MDQYILFCKIFDEQKAMYPDDKPLAVRETIRICIERDILKEYLLSRREEVATIMLTFLDQQAAMNEMVENEKRKAMIQATIETYQEVGKNFADVIALLAEKFGLTESASKRFVNQYWRA